VQLAPLVLLIAAVAAGCVDDGVPFDGANVTDPPTPRVPPGSADAQELLELAEAQVVAPDGAPRYRTPGTAGHADGLAVLRDLMAQRGLLVTDDAFSADLPLTGPVNLTNLVGVRPGTSDHEIWLAAHWDSRARADDDPDPALRSKACLGANDGAASVAVVLHAMDLLPPTNATIRVVLFDGEDQGEGPSGWAVGSDHMARSLDATALARIEAMLLIDMPGDPELQVRREGYSHAHARWLTDLVFAVAAQQGATSFIDALGPQILDDHRPFLDRGVAAVDLIHLDDDSRRGPFPWTHHTTHDTLENLSGERMAEVTNVLVGAILELDGRAH